MVHESPEAAARRISGEQLGLQELPLSGPLVVSEVYTPRRFPDLPEHWDLEFIFRGYLSEAELPRSDAWLDLRFVDITHAKKSEIARSHEDVLESVGFRFSE